MSAGGRDSQANPIDFGISMPFQDVPFIYELSVSCYAPASAYLAANFESSTFGHDTASYMPSWFRDRFMGNPNAQAGIPKGPVKCCYYHLRSDHEGFLLLGLIGYEDRLWTEAEWRLLGKRGGGRMRPTQRMYSPE